MIQAILLIMETWFKCFVLILNFCTKLPSGVLQQGHRRACRATLEHGSLAGDWTEGRDDRPGRRCDVHCCNGFRNRPALRRVNGTLRHDTGIPIVFKE